MKVPEKAHELQLELVYPEHLDAVYSNHVQLNISVWDVIFDFGTVDPRPGTDQAPKAFIHNRIIMSPNHAKQFAKILNENIGKYEEIFGVLNVEPKKG
ncbi:MAG: DUF3467 domain-containing protein [Proteobacteria bacterium]|nr:DUF3467 domain-containing protein [Pseudomonadota bacterium]